MAKYTVYRDYLMDVLKDKCAVQTADGIRYFESAEAAERFIDERIDRAHAERSGSTCGK